MKTELYKITTLSNLHVGSGDINFDVIDNQVQRDAISNLPNINSSSLKGAFREHFSKDGNESNMVKYIFGPENNSNDSHQTGAYSFFEASLLTRPVRSNVKEYFNATSKGVIKNLLSTIENFDIDFDEDLKTQLEKLLNLGPKTNKPIIFENIEAMGQSENGDYSCTVTVDCSFPLQGTISCTGKVCKRGLSFSSGADLS